MTYAKLINRSSAEYRADPCETPSLNQSIAKVIVTESPLHGWYLHPRLGGGKREATAPMNAGTIIHKLLLGIGSDIVVVRADDFKTKAAQAVRDDAIAAHKVPVIAHKYDGLVAAANAIDARLKAIGINLADPEAVREQMVEWDEDTADGPVRCRGMFDFLKLALAQVFDPKSAENAHPDAVQRQIVNMGYDIQEAAYTSAVEKLAPEFMGKVDFGFLFMELSPPYGILPVRTSEAMKEHGRSRWNRAVRIWQQCLKSGIWPGYSDGWMTIQPTPWQLTAEMEQS